METPEREPGRIVTFYSYKGGTGRSMALANVAWVLAQRLPRDQRVLMIDWDLEAPGLDRYFYSDFQGRFGSAGSESYGRRLREAPGLMDFVIAMRDHYAETLSSGDYPESRADAPEALEAFAAGIERHPLGDFRLQLDQPENLHLMTAGGDRSAPPVEESSGGRRRSADYAQRVRSFDWETFYRGHGSFFSHFREHLMQEYAWVLIDSRTGLTDTSGICTRVMPEQLVAVFIPNLQNLYGVERVVRGAVSYRGSSRDDRGLMVFPLASRIDSSRSKLRRAWWKGGDVDGETIEGYETLFEKVFDEIYELDGCELGPYFDATQVPHDSDYAFGEKVAARVDTTDSLGIGYRCANLATRLESGSAPWETQEGEAAEDPRGERRSLEEERRERAGRARALAVAIVCAVIFLAGGIGWNLFNEKKHAPEKSHEITAEGVLVEVRLTEHSIPALGVGKAGVLLVASSKDGNGQPRAVRLRLSAGTLDQSEGVASFTETRVATIRAGNPANASLTVTDAATGSETQVPVRYEAPLAVFLSAAAGALLGWVAMVTARGEPARRREALLLALTAMPIGLLITMAIQSFVNLGASAASFFVPLVAGYATPMYVIDRLRRLSDRLYSNRGAS